MWPTILKDQADIVAIADPLETSCIIITIESFTCKSSQINYKQSGMEQYLGKHSKMLCTISTGIVETEFCIIIFSISKDCIRIGTCWFATFILQ